MSSGSACVPIAAIITPQREQAKGQRIYFRPPSRQLCKEQEAPRGVRSWRPRYRVESEEGRLGWKQWGGWSPAETTEQVRDRPVGWGAHTQCSRRRKELASLVLPQEQAVFNDLAANRKPGAATFLLGIQCNFSGTQGLLLFQVGRDGHSGPRSISHRMGALKALCPLPSPKVPLTSLLQGPPS